VAVNEAENTDKNTTGLVLPIEWDTWCYKLYMKLLQTCKESVNLGHAHFVIDWLQCVRCSNDWIGPPHTSDWSISDVLINEATQQCLGDWVCEHRWPLITAMVRWRSVAADTPLRHWWDDGQRQIAFARDGKAFLAINDDQHKSMNVQLQTGLPAGVYCDVTSGALTQNGRRCTGRSVTGKKYDFQSLMYVVMNNFQ